MDPRNPIVGPGRYGSQSTFCAICAKETLGGSPCSECSNLFVIATDGLLPLGDGYVSLMFPIGGKPFAFRATGAERVEGIDYDAFKIYSVWVGQDRQWTGSGFTGKELWLAIYLFEKWDVPMDVVQPGLDIVIQLRNVSDRPQKFAVKLVGELLL